MRSFLRLLVMGFATAATIVGPAIAGGAGGAGSSDDSLVADGPPWIRKWGPPALPGGVLLKPGESRTVMVRFIVDEHGLVTSVRVRHPSDPKFDAAAVAAVRSWGFTPAISDGKPVTMCMDGPVIFRNPSRHGMKLLVPPMEEQAKPSPLKPAEIKNEADAEYPDELAARKLPGKVVFQMHVDAAGHLQRFDVVAASHAAFVNPAIQAVRQWTFTPARQGDLAAPADLVSDVEFASPTDTRADVLAANFITGADGQAPDPAPPIEGAADPVWPYEALLAGKGGEATVAFKLTNRGVPTDIAVKSASAPDFGASLSAAVAEWQFDPVPSASDDGETPLVIHWRFTPSAPASDPRDPSDTAAAVLSAERAHQIGGAGALDHPLHPLYRRMPVPPPDQTAAGRATLDAVICRDGRVRLVRIVSSTEADLGWAAATAFSQWVFDPPTRAGRPVDVRVRLPFEFPAP